MLTWCSLDCVKIEVDRVFEGLLDWKNGEHLKDTRGHVVDVNSK